MKWPWSRRRADAGAPAPGPGGDSTLPGGVPAAYERALPLLRARAATGPSTAKGTDAFEADLMPRFAGYGLRAVVAGPDGDEPVTRAVLAHWGVDVAVAVSAGLRNQAGEQAAREVVDGVHRVTSAAFAAAALRASDGAVRVSGVEHPVMIIPSVDTVLLASADDPDALHALGRLAAEHFAGAAAPVSTTPLVRAGGEWAPFVWPDAAAR